MKKYTDKELEIVAYKWLLNRYREQGVPEEILEGNLEEVSNLFLADPEPAVPDTSERLSLIEQMILAEGTAMQADVLKQMQELNEKTKEMEALHKEWEKTIDEQLALQYEYQSTANTLIRDVVRDILNGEVEVWVDDYEYNDNHGYFTVQEADLKDADPKEFWDGYIQAKIVEAETGVTHRQIYWSHAMTLLLPSKQWQGFFNG